MIIDDRPPQRWNVASQVRIPGTLPTLPHAKAALREARATYFVRKDTADKFAAEVKRAKAEFAQAEQAYDDAERILLDAAAGSPEETRADGEHDKADRAVEKAEGDLAKVKKASDKAHAERDEALSLLVGARRTLREIRQGRRAR